MVQILNGYSYYTELIYIAIWKFRFSLARDFFLHISLVSGKGWQMKSLFGLQIHKRLNKGTPRENIANELKVPIGLPDI